jgi:hypothetical protein
MSESYLALGTNRMASRWSPDHVNISLIGHSFVKRLREKLAWMGYDVCWEIAEALKLEEITPFLNGKSGAKITSLKKLSTQTISDFPNIIMIDLGSNDLCFRKNGTPEALARRYYNKMLGLFNDHISLQLIVYIKVIQRSKEVNHLE